MTLVIGGGLLFPLLVLARGKSEPPRQGRLERVWGDQGLSAGQLYKPRAMAFHPGRQELFLVDKTARIQVYDRDGHYLRGWQTPESVNGKPTGLSFSRDGLLMVADTHYFRILFYRPDGQLVNEKTLGGQFGQAPGTFGFVTDVAEDSRGCLYVSEYGEFDRIQKFSPDGEFLFQWGGHGSEPGEFIRPQNVEIDEHDHLWVADACNDRIQVFDATGDSAKLVQGWGERGESLGQLRYPYDLLLDGKGHVYVCEFGNHRVQKFTLDGQSLGVWGEQGRGDGQLFNPWAIEQDHRGRLFVLDTYNHRVQRVHF